MPIYKNPTAFRKALEDRLRRAATEREVSLESLRYAVVFDRFLARVFGDDANPKWALKGGYNLQLRLENARTTKDIDLISFDQNLVGANSESQEQSILAELRAIARIDLEDYFSFQVSDVRERIEQATVGGARFTVKTIVDGKEFVTFRLDVVLAELPNARTEELPGDNLLGFIGLPVVRVRAISDEQQFAEKLHAYTYERENQENSRVRDLVDMCMLIQNGINLPETVPMIEDIFAVRKSHRRPSALAQPPESWREQYETLAQIAKLDLPMDKAFKVLAEFYSKLYSKTRSL
jgi:hypothetical protein